VAGVSPANSRRIAADTAAATEKRKSSARLPVVCTAG